jgi:hypothetical protein
MKSKYQNDQKANFGNEHSLFAVEAISADITLTTEDSGKFYTITAASGTVAITLPTSLSAGIRYDFAVLEDTPSNAVTIAAGSAIVDMVVGSGDASTAKIETTAGTAISNVIIGTSAKQGCTLRFVCDGTTWYVSGNGTPDNWVTTS